MEMLPETINCHRLPLPRPPEEPEHSSAMEIGSNEDLSTEILLRLPLKDVLRFKLVSKQWLSIVSTPRFLRLHTSRRGANPSPTGLLFKFINRERSNSEEFDYVPLKSDNNHRPRASSFDYIIQGASLKLNYKSSCNGLLLFKSSDDDDDDDDEYIHDGEYYVTNPTTKKFKIIPILPRTSNFFLEYLAFDPSQSPHYKVVIVSYDGYLSNESRIKFEIDVCPSENEICSPSERNSYSFDLDHFSTPPTASMDGIFCNGILHMHGMSWTTMLCFDLNHQYLIKCPVPLRDGWVRYSLKQSRGTIYLLVAVADEIDVHELKRDYSGWVLKCHLDLNSIAMDCQQIIPNFPSPDHRCILMMSNSILFMSILREEEGPTMVFGAFGQLVAYNLTSKTTKIIGNDQLLYNGRFRHFSEMVPFIETLARV